MPRALFIAALFAGAAFGWLLHAGKVYVWDMPNIRSAGVEQGVAQCSAAVSQIALEAESDERQRQRQANAFAIQNYKNALADSQRELRQAQIRLEMETAKHEDQLRDANRYCGLSQSDVDFMYQR